MLVFLLITEVVEAVARPSLMLHHDHVLIKYLDLKKPILCKQINALYLFRVEFKTNFYTLFISSRVVKLQHISLKV